MEGEIDIMNLTVSRLAQPRFLWGTYFAESPDGVRIGI